MKQPTILRRVYCLFCETKSAVREVEEPEGDGRLWIKISCAACGLVRSVRNDFEPGKVGVLRRPRRA